MTCDPLLLRLKSIGMSEYEAKVYVILIALRVASAREIHDLTKIPRGRVYETLSSLIFKGFVVSSNKSPVRYVPVDVNEVFGRLKRESVTSLDGLCSSLKNLEKESPEPVLQGYELRTDWTRENQILLMLHRAKSEIIFLCNDEEIITKYSTDLSRAAKKIPVYFVIGKPELAGSAPVKCYAGGTDIESSIFHHEAGENVALSMKLFLLADRRESLSVMEENGRVTGVCVSPDIYAGFIARKIIREIRPVKQGR